MRKKFVAVTTAFASITVTAAAISTFAHAAPSISQHQVWKTMFYATQNYSTVQGTMTYNLPPNEMTMSFGVQEGSTPQGYENVKNLSTEAVSRTVFMQNKLLNVDVTHGVAQEKAIKNSSQPQLPTNLPVPNKFSIPDPAMAGIEHTLTDPFELLHALLDNFENWSVVGTSSEFGREVYNISGTLDPSYGARFNANHFTMVVDANTGVVFNVTFLNANGQSTGSVSMDSVTFNQPLASNELSLTVPNGIKLVNN